MRWLAHLLFASGAEQARAVTVYSYTGNLFATITDNTPPAGTYDNTMRLTGWFSIAQPLLPNLSLVDITSDVLDFSFFEGREQYTKAATVASFDLFSTDFAGNITGWGINGQKGATNSIGGQISFFNTYLHLSTVSDSGQFAECVSVDVICSFQSDLARNKASPGSWSVAETPLPAALPLFATGLGALGLLGWRRKKNAAALAA